MCMRAHMSQSRRIRLSACESWAAPHGGLVQLLVDGHARLPGVPLVLQPRQQQRLEHLAARRRRVRRPLQGRRAAPPAARGRPPPAAGTTSGAAARPARPAHVHPAARAAANRAGARHQHGALGGACAM